MANGLALPRSAGLPHFASRFARSGFNVFLFDFRHLGDSTGLPRQIVSMISQLEDYLTVLKFVTEPESHSKLFENFIDPKKVILWGWSNSGGHVSKLATNPDLKLCGVDERFERDLHLRISGVICLDPMCDGIKNLKHHVWNNPLGLAKIGHYVLGDLIISMIPFLSKRYSINVPALGPGGFLGSEEAERGAKMIASQSSEEAEKEGEEFQNVNTMTADQTKLKKSGEKRSKLVGMQDLGPKFVNLVAARYGYDVMFQNSNGSSVNCSILVSWSKDKGDGLITDQVPRSFLNHCQKLLSQSSTKHQKTSLNDSESTTSVKEIDLNRIKRTTVEVESFEHEGDHFGLHFGGIGFEDGIKRQIEFIKKLI
ncbi:hypothetical protein BY996DRAFT_4622739 [Phakopsora pachyrhizi]|nr:hypothetical protein BY996DRAFT_4622739 [Phakopsora pachyrhizi]